MVYILRVSSNIAIIKAALGSLEAIGASIPMQAAVSVDVALSPREYEDDLTLSLKLAKTKGMKGISALNAGTSL